MKKSLIFTICALVSVASLQAQTKTEIAQIRKAYAEAKDYISQQSGEDAILNNTTITVNRMVSGTGAQKEVYQLYYIHDDSYMGEDNENHPYCLLFCTKRYNVSARNFYEEYLFDPATGSLRFFFRQYDSWEEEGKKIEERHYATRGQSPEETRREEAAVMAIFNSILQYIE